ncbi:hypothetical protein I5R65_21635 [Herbaspirillum sp. AP02]|uniref:DUF6471 domain-containing protein n=1 Tax=unclassified Herbaspirillum TaxID=2624150 RepID=UPI0015DB4C5E|nr:hypothetical protein [Herbaspirillum sp. AP02]NZD69102.1 hypothetical protein [Herbaspirillum sp. AP21]
MAADAKWAALASRIVRVVMARKDVAYDLLAFRLADLGVHETKSGLASRLSRGRISLPLFLQILKVSGAKVPPQWASAYGGDESWECRAVKVVEAELARRPLVSMAEMLRRVVELDAGPTEHTLMAHISSGTISLASFLQCLVVLGSESLELYLDFEDMAACAKSQRVPAAKIPAL